MPFTIPQSNTSLASAQSTWYETDIDALVAGIGGDGVLSGCTVSAQGSPNMTVAVASGAVVIGGTTAAVASGNLTIGAAHATHPRIDLITVNASGVKAVTAGTAAANPDVPAIPASSVLLATVYVPALATTITSAQIVDKRVLVPGFAEAIADERATRAEADAAEATTRADADAALSASMTAEASTRSSADTTQANNLTSHVDNSSNPHGVTAAQVGAYTSGQVDTLIAGTQPIDSDLTAIAALTTTPFGRALLALADAAALRTAGGLVIGTDVQAQSANLTAWATVTQAANQLGVAAYIADRGLLLAQATAPAAHVDVMSAGVSSVNTNGTAATVNGGRMIRWVAPRTTNVVAFLTKIAVASGNIEASIYDEHLVKLGGTGPIACPSAINGRHLTFPTGVPVTAGKTYYLVLAMDNTTASFGALNNILVAGSPVVSALTSVYPTPTRINAQASGVNLFSGTAAFMLIPLMEPVLVRKVATDLTVGMTAIVGYDPTSGRLFGRSGSATLAWADTNGTVVTTGAAFTGETIRTAKVAGAYLFVATSVTADGTGKLYRAARTGPYAIGNFTTMLTSQEGYSQSWNLAAYDDGVVFAGNYTAPTAAQVRLRRSPDFGATWSVVVDLGAGGSSAEHVHSVIRDPADTTKVYCNIGDTSASSGLYVSTDSGATFSRKTAFSTIRLTPACMIGANVLFGSDQYGTGGNLFLYDTAADSLQPYSLLDAPWYGDVYALHQDTTGWIWFMNRGEGTNASRRAGLFVSPDNGVTSYLVADLGVGINPADFVCRVGSYVYLGDGKRFPVSSIAFS